MRVEHTPHTIYLDYAAATPMLPEAVQAMEPYFTERFYNPSAPYSVAREVRADLEGARATLARLIGAKPDTITLCAGATEANNIALHAAEGKILVPAIEHESILACARAHGCSIIPVHVDGRLDMAVFEKLLTSDVGLVSVSLANGEIGTIQPVREVAELVDKERERRLAAGETRPLYLHTDASQAASALALNISSLKVDMMTVSAAKIYGPKQVGMLWTREGIPLKPLIEGGGQESGVRSGTENVAGVIGFAKAFETASEWRSKEAKRLRGLRNELQRLLTQRFPWAVVSGPKKDKMRLPGLLHISFPGIEARRLVILLEEWGVFVGTGSACAASRMRVSHVLKAIGAPEEVATGSLRITLGASTTEEDIHAAAQAITEAVEQEVQRLGLDPATGEHK